MGLKKVGVRNDVIAIGFRLYLTNSKRIKYNKKGQNRFFYFALTWRWGDSNSCPNIFFKSFLHAYLFIGCRGWTGKQQTDLSLSCMFLSNRHSLRLQQPVLVFESAAELGDRPTCSTRPKWLSNHWLGSHGILSIAIWVLNIQISVLIIQRTACLHSQRSTLSKPGTPETDYGL